MPKFCDEGNFYQYFLQLRDLSIIYNVYSGRVTDTVVFLVKSSFICIKNSGVCNEILNSHTSPAGVNRHQYGLTPADNVQYFQKNNKQKE